MKRQLSKRWEKSEEKMVQNKVAPKLLDEVDKRAINTRITLEALMNHQRVQGLFKNYKSSN
ncbi:hypothetical protein [Bacillus mobilis]|nr:hypothetical protein [Bacillus mobilis]